MSARWPCRPTPALRRVCGARRAVAVLAVLVASCSAEEVPNFMHAFGGSNLRRKVAAALRAAEGDGRRLETPAKTCQAVALRVMPPPAWQDFQACYQAKMEVNSTHDWSVPGAEIAAQTECWCDANLTDTIRDFGCCEHPDLYPMCTVNCDADCDGDLAKTCIEECPSMCFEAAEYIVDKGLCTRCDWKKCWPVLNCMTRHAEKRVQEGDLARTCHDVNFMEGNELSDYWQCWRDAPKHSSHWNVLSSVVHCVCREGMVSHVRDHHCCDSMAYGGGVCGLACLSEAECNTQEAQTCIQRCHRMCPAFDTTPSRECMETCLRRDAPCRNYTSCRPPPVHTHICDDGRWPEASSGCCATNRTGGQPGVIYGCPKLCEEQQIHRMDGGRSIPWWSRWQPGNQVVAQCSCRDCPETTVEGLSKFGRTVEESIWDNGQIMLVDIARREGLQYGPNRAMQELMAERNDEILKLSANRDTLGFVAYDRALGGINRHYTGLIVEAAQNMGDDEYVEVRQGAQGREEDRAFIGLIAGACTVVIVATITWAACYIARRKKLTPVTRFEQNPQVVIGNPVINGPAGSDGSLVTGAPVTVTAPTKASSASPMARQDPLELS